MSGAYDGPFEEEYYDYEDGGEDTRFPDDLEGFEPPPSGAAEHPHRHGVGDEGRGVGGAGPRDDRGTVQHFIQFDAQFKIALRNASFSLHFI